MKKSACTTALLLTALLSVQADDSALRNTALDANASKTNAAGVSQPQPPTNLREDPAYNIPFPKPASGFQDNPDTRPIKIGPMPDSLSPMGPKKFIKITGPSSDNKGATGPMIDIPARPVVEIPQATEKTPSAGTSQESVTVSPFLDWIQNTKNAAEIARQQRQAIEQNDLQDKSPKDGTDQDLFVHIRFPYVGNQDLPPSGGSVTYSVPQR